MPMDRGTLDQQLQALGESSSWWERRELRDLPAILGADEEVRAIARGKLGRVRAVRITWLMVVTNRRLLCLRSGTLSWRQFEILANQILGVTLRMGVFRGRIIVSTSDRKYRLHLPGTDAYKLGAALSDVAKCGHDTLSGPTHMVRRIVRHVLALPAAAFNPPPTRPLPAASAETTAKDQRNTELEAQIEELQQQVKFLEQLVRQRQAALTGEQELLPLGESFPR